MADLRTWRPAPHPVVATVRTHGYVVRLRRGEGPHLVLEAVMTGRKRGAMLSADSGTADLSLGKARARAFAAGLAQETNERGKLPFHVPTYDELRVEIVRREVDAANLRTVLNRWLEVFALEADERVGTDMGEELEERLADFREALFSRGMKRKPVNSYITRARKLASIAGSMVRLAADGLTFGQALKQALCARGMTTAAAAEVMGARAAAVSDWAAGISVPGRKNRDALPALERALDLPDGWLASRLPALPAPRPLTHSRFGARLRELMKSAGFNYTQLARAADVGVSVLLNWMNRGVSPSPASRERVIPRLEVVLGLPSGHLAAVLPPLSIQQLTYSLQLNPAQVAEWDRLVAHKTNRKQRDASLRPNTYWKLKDGDCPTAMYYLGEMVRFKGYLALSPDASDPRMCGLGLEPDDWGLHNLANEQHVTGYLDFLAERTGYSASTEAFIAFVRSILRPGTGYLWQANEVDWTRFRPEWLHESLGRPPVVTREIWRSHCELVRQNLLVMLKHLVAAELIEQRRDYSHISTILEMPRPMDALCILEKRLLEYLRRRRGKVSDLDFAVDVRDVLLALMMMRNPLRAFHWQVMTFRPNGTGHLRRTVEGYELRFSKNEFKAISGIRQKEYRAFLTLDLTGLMDEYLQCWRPLLAGSVKSDRVFVSSVLTLTPGADMFDVAIALVRLTRAHLREYAFRGFAPHAMRHIIATHLVKNYEDGIHRAADALHNTPEMIRKHYGHLRAEDVTQRSHEIIQRELSVGRERVRST